MFMYTYIYIYISVVVGCLSLEFEPRVWEQNLLYNAQKRAPLLQVDQ